MAATCLMQTPRYAAPAQSLADEARVVAVLAQSVATDAQMAADVVRSASPEDVARIEAQDCRLKECSAAVAEADRKLINLHQP
jgi:hypothetical protein